MHKRSDGSEAPGTDTRWVEVRVHGCQCQRIRMGGRVPGVEQQSEQAAKIGMGPESGKFKKLPCK